MYQAPDDIRLPPKWIELNLCKRECSTFICTQEDELMCQCGKRKQDHDEEILAHPIRPLRGTEWSAQKHSVTTPTDAYGQIVFEGEHHPNKSRFVRLSYDTSPEIVLQLMTLVWGLEMPKLVITVRGGTNNFELPPRMGKMLQVGLLKAAKSTGAWIFSNGLNKGVTRHIGNALANERWLGFKRGRCISVGIAPWGLVEHRNDLIGRNRDRVYVPFEHPGGKFILLNPRHSNFLLVDNGSVGKPGGDVYFRKRLEKHLSTYPMSPHRGCDTPIVSVIIEGGLYTLKTIAEYLTDEPPIPVVVLGHTGRTADILQYVLRKCDHVKDLEIIKEELQNLIVHFYKINVNQSQLVLAELRKIVFKKNLLTIYVPHQSEDDGFDTVLLASIFRSQHWTPLQQLSLTLAWNRVDIANNEVFVYGREWSREHLEHAMMEALVSDRLDFVNLLLEHGLNMQTFLTPARLEGLYSLERTHSIQMRTLLFELAKIRSLKQNFPSANLERSLTLHDVGLAMSHMMGHIYKSKYIHLKGMRDFANAASDDVPGADDEDQNLMNVHCFTQPFDDLFIWAILTKRHEMALLLWGHGPGALAKALVAVKLNSYLAQELIATEKTNMATEFQAFSEEWENLSLELLDSCFRQDPKMARQLLTMELDHWSKQTCLTLAVMANHRMLLGHPCCQILLADLWMGALNLRRNSSLKIVLGILLPPLVFFWDYKSTEQLKLLPHKERFDVPMMTGANAELSYDTESLRTYSRSRGSYSSFFQKSEHERSDTASREGDSAVLAVNMQEVNAKLKEFKLSPPEHHHKHAHFHDKRPILDSGAAGSYIFDAAVENGGNTLQKVRRHEDPRRHHQKLVTEVPASSFVTTKHDLSPCSKFYEFQRAPVTNFYRHTMAYIIFVSCLAYLILVPQDKSYPSYLEYYLICYVGTHGCDCLREFLSIDANNWAQKWSEFRTKYFCLMDISMVIFFMTGAALRLTGSYDTGFLLYRVSSIYWNLRLYKYMGVHRFVGPKIVMMSRMLKHMAYFAMIIFVVLIAFGIARESIRFPDSQPSWRSIAEAFLEPYVMMFGEVDTDSLSSNCGEETQPECPTGHWIIPITWVIYMMVANILIVNVLIAVFNGIYSEVDAISLELWMFQRFTFVMEFEQKPLLPPPMIAISHVYSIVKYLIEKFVLCICEQELNIKGTDEEGPRVIMGNDHNLKTFLSSAETSMVFDFEEDNVDVLTTTNDRLRNKVDDQRDKIREQAPTTITEKMETARNGSLSLVKNSVREILLELSEQRRKLDKLLEIWEIAKEEDEAEEDVIKSVVIAKQTSAEASAPKSKATATKDSKEHQTQTKNA